MAETMIMAFLYNFTVEEVIPYIPHTLYPELEYKAT